MGSGKLAVIILTMNEEIHIERAIHSIRNKADEIFVIDSMSTDRTVEIARSLGATIFQKPWISYSEQLNWALSKLPHDVDWVFRLDADEYVLPETDIKQDIWRLSEGALRLGRDYLLAVNGICGKTLKIWWDAQEAHYEAL